MAKRCIIFAPHQDDTVFGCGGLIQQKIKSGFQVFIIDITDGKNCFYNLFGIKENPTPEQLSEIRKKEEINAAKCLGIPTKNVFFLNMEECVLIKNIKNAIDKTYNIVKEIDPKEIFVPSIYDMHFDHVITNLLVKKVIKNLKLKVNLYEYFIWRKIKFGKIKNKKLVEIDISKEIKKKKEAINCYQSQISLFVENQEKPVLDSSVIELFLEKKEFFKLYEDYKGIGKIDYYIKLLKIKLVYSIKKVFRKHPIFFQN